MPSGFVEVSSTKLTASASLGMEHSGVCRTLGVPVVDMTGARRFRVCTTWLTADLDGLEVELMSGAETGSPWLKLWAALPDGRRVNEGINVVDMVEAWAGAIAARADTPSVVGNDARRRVLVRGGTLACPACSGTRPARPARSAPRGRLSDTAGRVDPCWA